MSIQRATVVNDTDPLGRGRVQVQVPDWGADAVWAASLTPAAPSSGTVVWIAGEPDGDVVVLGAERAAASGTPRPSWIGVGDLALRLVPDSVRWEIADGTTAPWGAWVRLAKRILDTDALARDVEGRGDAWDQGRAADASAENPYR